MRRLSMKNKRRQSETTSDSGSEENGVTPNATSDAQNEMKKDKEIDEVESSRKSTAKKRPSRGRHSQKNTSEEPVSDSKVEGEDNNQVTDAEEENGNVGKGGVGKRRKKEDQKASTSITDELANNEKEYDVEKIVGQRTIKGRRQFLVRWKGYGEDSDTWEQEKDLNCPQLIQHFLTEEEEKEEENEEQSPVLSKAIKVKTAQTDKKSPKLEKKSKTSRRQQGNGNDKPIAHTDTPRTKKEEQKEFEVEKIIEVHFKKNKMREFLIRWKGFTSADDTWEPEQNLNCPDLIAKFMQKVEKAKTADVRELRTNRVHTKRYTLTTHESGRRLSRRNMDKQRATYHECDE